MSQAMSQTMSGLGVVTEPGTVRIERVLPGPIERVWAYLTEPEKRSTWFAGGPMELRVGGRVELIFQHENLTPQREPTPERFKECDGSTLQSRILACDPPRLLSYTFSESPGDESEVYFELTPRGEEVVLVLTHRRLADRKAMVSVASGWHSHLAVLEERLNGRELYSFWRVFEEVEAQYEQQIPAQ